MGISVFLQQIPCWTELCQLLSTMNDQEINDLIAKAWDYGSSIAWGDESHENGGISTFIPWNADKNTTNMDNNQITERFSAALRYVHDKKLAGDYIERDIHIQLKCGGKSGKFWKLETKDCTYTVSYGKLHNNSCSNPNTMTKTFPNASECLKQAQKKIKEKKKKKYKLDWDKSANSSNQKYNNEYLQLAQQMDETIHLSELKKKEFAHVIGTILNNLFDENICDIISNYCNEDKIDHYNCDKAFDDIGCPNTPIARLLACVENTNDKSPSAFDIHLMEGIYGNGQEFGNDVCYGSIRLFTAKEMKIFATKMIRRLVHNINGGDELFGIKMDNNNNNICSPSIKKRKLNDNKTENVCQQDFVVFSDEIIYKFSYALSASGIFNETKQDIVWRKVFRLNEQNFPENTYEGNHSLCALCFGLNAAAMNRGVIVHYW